jgi:hypothetical protein
VNGGSKPSQRRRSLTSIINAAHLHTRCRSELRASLGGVNCGTWALPISASADACCMMSSVIVMVKKSVRLTFVHIESGSSTKEPRRRGNRLQTKACAGPRVIVVRTTFDVKLLSSHVPQTTSVKAPRQWRRLKYRNPRLQNSLSPW